ncbi:uncharacterized protein F4812DRAFT_428963 [Daldinia caldariorum]|uniref:uncharacterized protein n=1 Tax=Daldinia caldariorum TaxID=326644 RepID=UPI00200876C4|nr:uncharacterized protein F4812DRAFT_428963 [Daldinia caldariorum]KAI1468118.1 hypothetical protein F4812DRAFT_428963 [Daldinia caldariorum]
MSLGIKSLWRAQCYIAHVSGLSLIPREQCHPLYQELNLRRWISTGRRLTRTNFLKNTTTNESPRKIRSYRAIIRAARKQVTNTRSGLKPKTSELVKRAVRYPTKQESHRTLRRRWRSAANEPSKKIISQSAIVRAARKQIIKTRSGLKPKASEVVKREILYPTKRESRRSLRKRRHSAARQHIYDSERESRSERFNGWQPIFDLMYKHTVDISEILHFRIIIGKGIAAEARVLFSEPDTHISQIGRRNESHVQIIEQPCAKNEGLILSLSGSEDSVRKTLVDIVGVVGKITAVRVSDPATESLLSNMWKDTTEKRPEILLFEDGEVTADDRMLTVQSSSNSTKYKTYRLKRRANNVNRPGKWTQDSFEKYVASLVYGRMPPHVARKLYPTFPDHQEVVVNLLTALFTAEHTRKAASLSALKMAIEFIESRGRGFRQASRTIFNQAELLGLPMDAEVFNIFLISASKAADLEGFYSILKAMIRKGFAPQGRSWVAFLEMIQSVHVKRFIITMLRHKGLNHNSSTLCAIGRQIAIVDLEHSVSEDFDIQTFIHKRDRKYGPRWLDTITVNKLMDILGAHQNWDACNVLLDHIYATGITSPNAVTLNIFLTHTRSLPLQLGFMKSMFTRWRRLVPNPDTYHILFREAWTKTYPNMLRVVFRYAIQNRRTTPKMRYVLNELLTQDVKRNTRWAFLKTWEDVIFGQEGLAEARSARGDTLELMHLIYLYVQQARGMRLKDLFMKKLEEAVEMDVTIHQLLKNRMIVKPSASVRASLSVPIPLMKLKRQPKPWGLWKKGDGSGGEKEE